MQPTQDAPSIARSTLPPSLDAALRGHGRRRALVERGWLLLVPILVVGGWWLWTSWGQVTTRVRLIAALRARGVQVDSIDGGSVWWEDARLAVGMPKSGYLRLSVSDRDLARACTVGRIESLDLSGAPEITDAGLAPVANLAELRELYLGGREGSILTSAARLTPAALDHVRKLPKLEYLSLEGLPIVDDDLARLAAMPNLQSIVLTGTKVTREGILALQQARPTLAIEHDLEDEDLWNKPGTTADGP